jgi:hypothetical protein
MPRALRGIEQAAKHIAELIEEDLSQVKTQS